MSKFKNKKALALSVGAIMAGVSVIGVVAACAPTKAKPNKPSQGTQNPSQSGGTESTNPGSGNTSNPSRQGSGTSGTTNANPGSGSTTTTKPKEEKMEGNKPSPNGDNVDKSKDNMGSQTPDKDMKKDGDKPNVGSSPSDNPNVNDKGENKGSETDGKTEQDGSDKKEQEDAEKLKAQKEAETALANKKTKTKEMISKLENLSDEDKENFSKSIDAINDPNQSSKIDEILKNAQEKDATEKAKKEATEALNTAKKNAKDEIKKLGYLTETERTNLNKEVDDIVDVAKLDDVAKVLEKAKTMNTKNQEEKQKEANTIAKEIKFNKVVAKRDPTAEKYFILEIRTTPDFYDKIKDKLFGYTIFNKDANGDQDDITNGANLRTRVIKKDTNSVTFEIFPGYPQEKGNYKITKIWLADDLDKKNLLPDGQQPELN